MIYNHAGIDAGRVAQWHENFQHKLKSRADSCTCYFDSPLGVIMRSMTDVYAMT